MKKLILASTSPRRKALLEQVKLDFEVCPSPYEEDSHTDQDPVEFVKKQAIEKAKAVAREHPNAVVLGADTIIVCEEKVCEKPITETKAKEMLVFLSGKKHKVITGYAIVDSDTNKKVTGTKSSTVWFKDLTDKEIEWYVGTGEPLDKAGAYGIQSLGVLIVTKIEGDYTNIVGFPLVDVVRALKEFDALPANLR